MADRCAATACTPPLTIASTHALTCDGLAVAAATRGRLSVAPPTVGTMTGLGVRWTAEEVLALAPDDASRKAGSKLSCARTVVGGRARARRGVGAVQGEQRQRQAVPDGGGSRAATGRATGRGTSAVAPAGSSPASTRSGCCCCWAGERVSRTGTDPAGVGRASGSSGRARARRATSGRRNAAGGQRGERRRRGSASGDGCRPTRGRAAAVPSAACGASPPAPTELEQRLADLLRGGLAGAEQSGRTRRGRRWRRAWSMPRLPVWPPAYGSWAPFPLGPGSARSSGGHGRNGCWPSARCSTCSTRAGPGPGRRCRSRSPRPCGSRVGLTVDAAGAARPTSRRCKSGTSGWCWPSGTRTRGG